ncbi:hypothetical protein FQR65_LT15117 [Abscondita terminalis]|nr:hypothetical protein FQR65_LT15117 [Abscondita terminalis]
MRCMKPIQTNNDTKYILLNPTIRNWTDLEDNVRNSLANLMITAENFSTMKLKINYDNYHADEVFKAILPKDLEGFSSFSQVGHIIHLNLREHLCSYKGIIGEVLLDKIPRTRTVVNKVDAIDNTYRNFEMEKLCGDDDMQVKIKENNCEFEFDFSKVYWNSRLGTEHERIVKMLKSGDVLFDVFAGVGPFAIPAAKKGCLVYANDLNPESFKWLNHNKNKNKLKNNLHTYNKDGHLFIKEDLKIKLIEHINKCNVTILMNLPAMAVEFLQNFCNMYTETELSTVEKPLVLHVYCFAKGEDSMSIARRMINEHFGFNVDQNIINIFSVRTISIKNKDKVLEMDKKLVEFRTQLQKDTSKAKTALSPNEKQNISESVEDYEKSQKKSEQTLQELNQMELQDS